MGTYLCQQEQRPLERLLNWSSWKNKNLLKESRPRGTNRGKIRDLAWRRENRAQGEKEQCLEIRNIPEKDWHWSNGKATLLSQWWHQLGLQGHLDSHCSNRIPQSHHTSREWKSHTEVPSQPVSPEDLVPAPRIPPSYVPTKSHLWSTPACLWGSTWQPNHLPMALRPNPLGTQFQYWNFKRTHHSDHSKQLVQVWMSHTNGTRKGHFSYPGTNKGGCRWPVYFLLKGLGTEAMPHRVCPKICRYPQAGLASMPMWMPAGWVLCHLHWLGKKGLKQVRIMCVPHGAARLSASWRLVLVFSVTLRS